MPWTETAAGSVWVDPNRGKAAVRAKEGGLLAVDPARAEEGILAGEYTAATEAEIGRAEQTKTAHGGATLAATSAVAGVIDAVTGGQQLQAAIAEGLSRAVIRRTVGAGMSDEQFGTLWDQVKAAAPAYVPTQKNVRQALGGREVQENVVALAKGERAAQDWRKAEQLGAVEHPIATAGGYIAGQIGAGLIGGGLTAPARALGIAGKAALGVAEGAALGSGMVGEDAFLHDQELTAEHVLAGAGLAALIGGGAVLGLHGAGRAFQRIASRGATGVDAAIPEAAHASGRVVADEMATAVLGRSPQPETVSWLQRAFRKPLKAYEATSSMLTGHPEEAIARFGVRAELEGTSMAGEYAAREATKTAVKERMYQAIAKLDDNSSALEDAVRVGTGKQSAIAKLVDVSEGALERQRAASYAEANRIRGVAENLVEKYGKQAGADVRYVAGRLGELSETLAASKNGAEMYGEMDLLRYQLQRMKHQAETVARTAPTIATREHAAAISLELEAAQEPLRQSLMDPAVWGQKAADAQRRVNAAWEAELGDKARGITGTRQVFEQNFHDVQPGRQYGIGGEVGGQRTAIVAHPKVDAFVEQYGRWASGDREANLLRQIETRAQLAEEIAGAYQLGPEAQAQARAVREAADEIKSVLGEHGGRLKSFAEREEFERASAGSHLGAGAGALGGGLVGGPIGAGVGAFLGAARDPAALARTVRAVMALSSNVRGRLSGSVGGLFSAPSAAERAIAGAAGGAGAATAAAIRGPVSAQGARLTLEQRQDRFRRQAELVSSVGDPVSLESRVSLGLGSLPSALPGTSAYIAAKAAGGAAYLQAILAPMIPPRPALQPNAPIPRMSRDALDKWDRVFAAVNSPLTVLRDWEHGTVTKDQVDALQAVWPRIYQGLQEDAADQIGALKGPMAYRKRRALDMLFGFNGAAEPTLTSTFLANVQQAAQLAPPAQPPPTGRAPKLAQLYDTQRMEQ